MAERTGSLAFIVLWSIAKINIECVVNIVKEKKGGTFRMLVRAFSGTVYGIMIVLTRMQKNITT